MLASLLFTLVAAAAPASAQVCSTLLPGEGDRHAGVDYDGDGIPDSDDWCATSPAGARVAPTGCADGEIPVACEPPPPEIPPPPPPKVDSDKDGVYDHADQCADTPRGMPVDEKGCVVIEKVVLSGVNFALGSVQLAPSASATLRQVARAMQASPDLQVEIGGHTDSIGPADKNQRLSERRANAVKQFLVGEGIAPERLTAKGYGEGEPVASNETTDGRAGNRRVAFKVMGK